MASSGKATLEQFSGGDFAEYRERLEFYFLANDIGVVSASANSSEKERVRKKMIAHLISSLSKDVYSTLRNLCLPESISDKTFEQICDLLNGYYRVERSTMTSSFQFRDCNQRPAEKLVDYANRLKRAAVACDFGSHLDRSLKDQFMAGVYSQEIKRTILTSPDSKTKKFQDVLDIALREERAIMFAEQLTPGTTTSTRSTSTPSESVNKMRATTTSKSKSASASRKPNHSQDQKGSKLTKGKVNDVVWKRHRNQLRPRSIPLSQLAEQPRSAPQQQQLQPQQQQQQQLSPQQQQPQPQQQQVPQQLPPQKAQQPTTSQQKEQPMQQSQDEQGQQSLASTAPADAVPVDRQVTRSGRSVVRPARYNG
ncbi:putative uncharacterized protein DDB_G0294196 [Sycon ciliatum]|uniref:putative uncharacterized protein DDB_G0294196 n=1 Tax=Sycon ciliatum TaxID=27933 RepID=UPI0031F64D1B